MGNTAENTASPTGPSIMVVDDNAAGAQTMGMLLELEGYPAILASTGAEAIALYKEKQPSVVILDIGLPDMDGYSVAKALRTIPCRERPLIVAVTGWAAEKDRELSRQAGCDLHLAKPVNYDQLEDIIEDFTSARRAERSS